MIALLMVMSLLLDKLLGCVSHFFQAVSFSSSLSAIVFDSVVVDFDLSLPVGNSFSSQMIVEPSISYWP